MEFIVSRNEITKSLQELYGLVGPNPLVPILENFLLEIDGSSLKVTASDMQTIMVSEVNIKSGDTGSIAIPAKLLVNTLKDLPEQPLKFKVDPNTFGIVITSNNGAYQIAGENAMDFPRIPDVNKNFNLELESSVLLSALNNTVFATGSDDLRPAMAGVYVVFDEDKVTFVATDGHRLVRYRRNDLKTDNPSTLILPKKALNLVKGSLPSASIPVNIEFSGSNAFFSFANTKLICRLIDERYPDYESVIPKLSTSDLVLERSTLMDTLKRVINFANKTNFQVRFKITPSLLTISAEDLNYSNQAVENIPCEFSGGDMEIGFNAKFLLEMVSNLHTPNVIIQLSLPNKAGLLIPAEQDENEEILMLVMPVMLASYS
jgi:DNA polymerase III subunit beta